MVNAEAHRCPKCKIVIFSYEKELASDLKLKLPKDVVLVYERLAKVYANLYAAGRDILDRDIQSIVTEEGLTQEEATLKLAKEKLV